MTFGCSLAEYIFEEADVRAVSLLKPVRKPQEKPAMRYLTNVRSGCVWRALAFLPITSGVQTTISSAGMVVSGGRPLSGYSRSDV